MVKCVQSVAVNSQVGCERDMEKAMNSSVDRGIDPLFNIFWCMGLLNQMVVVDEEDDYLGETE